MKFRELAIGQEFDFVNDTPGAHNSFFQRCQKISARKYAYGPFRNHECQVGSINVEVFHVEPPLIVLDTEAARAISPGLRVTPISYAPEVIADDSGKWVGNALRFATKAEAEANVADLFSRWMLVKETRVTESSDPVNYAWVNGRLEMAKA